MLQTNRGCCQTRLVLRAHSRGGHGRDSLDSRHGDRGDGGQGGDGSHRKSTGDSRDGKGGGSGDRAGGERAGVQGRDGNTIGVGRLIQVAGSVGEGGPGLEQRGQLGLAAHRGHQGGQDCLVNTVTTQYWNTGILTKNFMV